MDLAPCRSSHNLTLQNQANKVTKNSLRILDFWHSWKITNCSIYKHVGIEHCDSGLVTHRDVKRGNILGKGSINTLMLLPLQDMMFVN